MIIEEEKIGTDLRPLIFKQRRFFLSVSFLLTALYWLDIHIGQKLSSLGMEFSIREPSRILWALWPMWLWSLWRYYQYQNAYLDPLLAIAREKLTSQITLRFLNKFIQQKVREGQYENADNRRNIPRMARIGIDFPYGSSVPQKVTERGEWVFDTLNIYIIGANGQKTIINGGANTTLTMEQRKSIEKRVKSIMLLKYPIFTDYIAPYILGIIGPLSGVVYKLSFC